MLAAKQKRNYWGIEAVSLNQEECKSNRCIYGLSNEASKLNHKFQCMPKFSLGCDAKAPRTHCHLAGFNLLMNVYPRKLTSKQLFVKIRVAFYLVLIY